MYCLCVFVVTADVKNAFVRLVCILLVGLVGLGRRYRFPLAVQIDEAVPSLGGNAALALRQNVNSACVEKS